MAFCEAVLADFLRLGVFVSSSENNRFRLTSYWSKLLPESMLTFILFSTAMRLLDSCTLGTILVVSDGHFPLKNRIGGKTQGGINPLK